MRLAPRRLGLRARVTAAFALGALGLALLLSVITYERARTYLVRQREVALQRQSFVNARLVRGGLGGATADVAGLLDALELPPDSEALLFHQGRWFSSSLAMDQEILPAGLRQRVLDGTPARQRFRAGNQTYEAVGVPLPAVEAAYFEVFSLKELGATLRVLGTSLAVAAAITTVAGALLGRWASGRILRPVGAVADAAAAVAAGGFDTKLEMPADRDLTTVATAFNRMTDSLRQRVERDERFASDISHELRSPLTTLQASLQVLLARRNELPERARIALDLLADEVRRFGRMVEDLLEISLVDADSAQPVWEQAHLGEFLLHAAAASGANGLPVELDAAVADVDAQVDKRRLERVVANLVDNANRHGGGVVRIALEAAPEAARLVVEDAGPGVPRAERTYIFERFARGVRARAHGAGDGTGLGLSLVAEHARLHGGTVWVEDRAGGGARFVVELPLSR